MRSRLEKEKAIQIERVLHICKYQDEGNNVLRYIAEIMQYSEHIASSLISSQNKK